MIFIIHDNKTTKWHNPKGNISLIMLFVLAIAALMGLMSSHFLQSMIRETSAMRNNYQAYYLAKAGIELWTLTINSYDYGFTDTLSGWSDIFQKNILCTKGPCTIDLSIHSTITGWLIGKDASITIEDCTSEHGIALSSWSSLILPLFIDTRTLHNNQDDAYFKNIITNYKMSIKTTTNNTDWWLIGLGLVLWSGSRWIYDAQVATGMQKLYITWNSTDITVSDLIEWNKNIFNENGWNEYKTLAQLLETEEFSENLNLFNYLAITNIDADNISFCLDFGTDKQQYPLDTSMISSTASYRNTSLSLQGIIKKDLADYVYGSYQWN